ncbi:MAG: hypothetical protein AB8G05_21420 [Oligoflexales bacterium]
MPELLAKLLSLATFCLPQTTPQTPDFFKAQICNNVLTILPDLEVSPLAVFIDSQQDQNWRLWPEVYENQDTLKIVRFNDFDWLINHGDLPDTQRASLMEQALQLPKYQNSINDKELFMLWKEETIQTAKTSPWFFWVTREPDYLSHISHLLKNRLHIFAKNKERSLRSEKYYLIKHAYGIFFTMWAFNHVLENAARASAWSAAIKAAEASKNNFSWEEASDIAWNSAGDFTEETADSAAWFIATKAAEKATRELVEHNILYKAQYGASAEIEDTVKLHKKKLTEITTQVTLKNANYPEDIGKLAYRSAEKVWLLCFLKNFDSIIERSYIETIKNIPDSDLIDDIFVSSHKWKAFKSRFFEQIPREAKQFLEPWFDEIDTIVSRLEGLEV